LKEYNAHAPKIVHGFICFFIISIIYLEINKFGGFILGGFILETKLNKSVNRLFTVLLLLVLLFGIVHTINSASASISIGNGDIILSDSDADVYTDLSVKATSKGKVYQVKKTSVPKKYKQYENYTFKVAKGSKIYYKAVGNPVDSSVTNMAGLKVRKASISFGDKTKRSSTSYIAHKYTKSGWYLIKINIQNATFSKGSLFGMDLPGEIINGTKIYLVYVEDKAQLSVAKLAPSGHLTSNNKKYIDYLKVKITNIGSKTSKATKIKMFYQKPGSKNLGKVYSKLKKYTVSAKLKSLKPGKSAIVKIYFKIPEKYFNKVINLRLDSLYRVNQISRSDTLYSFKYS